MQEVMLFYNGLEVSTRQILDSRGAIPSKTDADAKVAIQVMAEYSQKWYNRTSRIRSTETSEGLAAIQAQLNNLGREIKKVNEKVYAAQVGCEQCKGPNYTKDFPLKEEGFYQRNNANPSYQKRRQSTKETLSKFMSESAKRHEENSNMIKEIRASIDAAVRNQGASIKNLEIQIRKISKGLEVGLIRRIQGIGYSVLEFLGVWTTFDIFQNIHLPYLQYGVLTSSRYGVLIFIPLWSLVSACTDTPYLP
ncbi:hypothetical protein Tco_0584514 [Tanacetum coccineum]